MSTLHVGDDVHNAAVGLLGQALGPDDVQAAVGVAQVTAHGLHVDVRIGQLEVLEEHAIEVVIVILPRVRQQAKKVFFFRCVQGAHKRGR